MKTIHKHAQDHLFAQVASAIRMVHESYQSENYWLDHAKAVEIQQKLSWILSGCMSRDVDIVIDLENDSRPERSFQLVLGSDKYTVYATMTLVDVEGPDYDIASELWDLLTTKFYRITPDVLTGCDEVYEQFVSDYLN